MRKYWNNIKIYNNLCLKKMGNLSAKIYSKFSQDIENIKFISMFKYCKTYENQK